MKKYGIHSIKNYIIMTKTDQYKNLYKKQKEEIRELKLDMEKLIQKTEEVTETLSILGLRLHILRHTPWWKMRKLIKLILKLRQS